MMAATSEDGGWARFPPGVTKGTEKVVDPAGNFSVKTELPQDVRE